MWLESQEECGMNILFQYIVGSHKLDQTTIDTVIRVGQICLELVLGYLLELVIVNVYFAYSFLES